MIIEKLKNIDIFEHLSIDKLEAIARISVFKKFSRDNILFYEGEEPKYFYLLLQGHVKLYKSDLKGHEIVLHYFSKPTLIAEMASLENVKFPATAIVTREETEVLLVKKEKFIEMLESDALFSFHLVKSLTKKVKQLEVVINRNMVYDALTKVASFISENPDLMEKYKNKEIANLLNMAPETLSRILSKLRKLDIIDKNNAVLSSVKLGLILDV